MRMQRLLFTCLTAGLLLSRGAHAQGTSTDAGPSVWPPQPPRTDAGKIDFDALAAPLPNEKCEERPGPNGKVGRVCWSDHPFTPRQSQGATRPTRMIFKNLAEKKKAVGSPTQTMVDSSGGRATSADGDFWIVFPPGALEGRTTISLQQFQTGKHAWVEVEPANLQLKVPAQYVYRLDQVTPGAPQVVPYFDPEHPNELVLMPGTEDAAAKTLTYEVTHL